MAARSIPVGTTIGDHARPVRRSGRHGTADGGTTDLERDARVARRIRTGTIGLNGCLPDITSPYGGVKGSGLGRELGPEGLAAYRQLQSIYHP